MTQGSKLKNDKIGQPETHFQSPTDVVKDRNLSREDKKNALNTWDKMRASC